MSKQELIKEYLELEKCLSRMEDENNRLRLESQLLDSQRLDGDDARVRELELELDRLRAENLQLLTENELHRQQERAPLSNFGDETETFPGEGAKVTFYSDGMYHYIHVYIRQRAFL